MTADPEGGRSRARHPRIAAVDALRGAALAAMVTFHLTWDLGYFGFISADFPQTPGFKAYGHAIASTFLALVGVSLVLAESESAHWRHFLLRFAKIAVAAALVTLATLYAFPQDFIFFGILHCIALASLAVLPFLRAPLWATIAAAGVAIALPFVAANPAFNASTLLWLGLGTIEPRTNDWRPFLPWFGVVLAGVAFVRAVPVGKWPPRLVAWRAGAWDSKSLVWSGRHSLLVYLVHQPILIGALYLVAQAVDLRPEAPEAPFLQNCQSQCVATGATTTYCGNVCRCIVTRAQGSDLWTKMLAQSPDPRAQESFHEVTRQCARDERPPEEP